MKRDEEKECMDEDTHVLTRIEEAVQPVSSMNHIVMRSRSPVLGEGVAPRGAGHVMQEESGDGLGARVRREK